MKEAPPLAVVDSDPRRLEALVTLLQTWSPQVEANACWEGFAPATPPELLLVNYDSITPLERTALISRFQSPAPPARHLILLGQSCRKDYATLFGARMLRNMMGRTEPLDGDELRVTVSKLLGRTDIFGLDAYFFNRGTFSETFRFRKTEERASLLAEVEKFALSLNASTRLAQLFCNTVDEVCSNALFNAPVDANGRRRFAHLERTLPVELEANESLELRLMSDGRRLAMSVTDPFGSLRPEQVMDYLARCFRRGPDQVEQKAGGAGLGLYTLFESLGQFVVSISPGQRTEVMGLLDLRRSFREAGAQGRSFHLFSRPAVG